MSRLVNCRRPAKHKKSASSNSIVPYLFTFDRASFQPPESPEPVDCRGRSSKTRSLAKVGVLLTVVGVIWFGLAAVSGTIAYYFDEETSRENMFGAALLDFELQSPGNFTPAVSSDHKAKREISVIDNQSVGFHYRVTGEGFSGELCNQLNVRALLKGEEKYFGPLTALQAGEFGFSHIEDWKYIASVMPGETVSLGGTCQFDLVFSGWQMEFSTLFSGFHDAERVPSRITAKAPQCDARSKGYWANHEGCSQGEGESVWTAEVQGLSAGYSGVFELYTGKDMCQNLWIPNCTEQGDAVAKRLCKARAHVLANELNAVSGKLDPQALLAGADNGDIAFENLGLSAQSSVAETLGVLEEVLADPFAQKQKLKDAERVAERLYTFYETENTQAPECRYEWSDKDKEHKDKKEDKDDDTDKKESKGNKGEKGDKEGKENKGEKEAKKEKDDANDDEEKNEEKENKEAKGPKPIAPQDEAEEEEKEEGKKEQASVSQDSSSPEVSTALEENSAGQGVGQEDSPQNKPVESEEGNKETKKESGTE